MKVLWLGGIILPRIAENEKLAINYMNGWLIKLSETLGKLNDIDLIYVFDSDKYIEGNNEFYKYYGLKCSKAMHGKLNNEYIDIIKKLLKNERPDVIHIWGTERPHCLAMVEACERVEMLNQVIISIQGLVSVYGRHYHAFLPESITRGKMIKDILKGNLQRQKEKFLQTGILEEKALRKVRHVIGRTDWDKACVWSINPEAKYHFNNETLRSEFYDGCWSYNTCEQFSIFCSQAHYPIKGLHLMIEALAIIKRQFPKAHLYVGGKNYVSIPTFKRSRYEQYIIMLIKKHNLINNVTFTGFLDAKKMKDRYLRSNVFVSPSSIENSPNSVGEAMLLGVPVVSSIVGGVHNLLEHGKDGFLYPADEPYMLAYYVCKIFEDESLATEFSRAAKDHAQITHNSDINTKGLIEIYKSLLV